MPNFTDGTIVSAKTEWNHNVLGTAGKETITLYFSTIETWWEYQTISFKDLYFSKFNGMFLWVFLQCK